MTLVTNVKPSNFKRDRWIAYINGECGPNGGKPLMIEVQPNKSMFGKCSKTEPYKATLNGVDVLAYGKTSRDAKLSAQTVLEESYIAAKAQMVFRVARDGTVYCARWIAKDRMEYYIVRGNAWPSSCVGFCGQSLQSYMDQVVTNYDACTSPTEVTA